jgi:hypothetical protein
MIRSLITGVGYAAAPKATFSVLHPRAALELKKLPFDLRHAYAPRLVAVAVALIAFPLGVLAGRSLARRSARRSERPARRRPQPPHAPHSTSRQSAGPARRGGGTTSDTVDRVRIPPSGDEA